MSHIHNIMALLYLFTSAFGVAGVWVDSRLLDGMVVGAATVTLIAHTYVFYTGAAVE